MLDQAVAHVFAGDASDDLAGALELLVAGDAPDALFAFLRFPHRTLQSRYRPDSVRAKASSWRHGLYHIRPFAAPRLKDNDAEKPDLEFSAFADSAFP